MAGFGSLGGLGGLGGMGSSFPTRFGTPQSNTVDWVPNAQEWQTDWDRRYAAEKERPAGQWVQGTELVSGGRGYSEGGAAPYQDDLSGAMRNAILNQFGVDPSADWTKGINADWLGGSAYAPGSESGASHRIMDGTQTWAPSMQNFAALDAEKARMTPLLENQTRQQQGYDSMRGWGQDNGVMGPNYSQPGFGQVGYMANDPAAEAAKAGVDMGWAQGFGAEAPAATGVYAPTAPRRSTGWGLF